MASTMERILQLKKIYLFTDLGIKELTAVGSIVQEETVAEGDVVIKEGEAGDCLYFILSGSVSVIKHMETSQAIHLADMGPNDYFGEMALFDNQPRSASVKAREDTQLLILKRFEFEELMKEYPRIAIHACRVFSQRFRELQTKVQQ